MASVTKNGEGKQSMADEDVDQNDREDSTESTRGVSSGGASSGGASSGGGSGSRAVASGGQFFTIYKRGQGYWTRMGTALASALIGVLLAQFTYSQTVAWLKVSKGTGTGLGLGVLFCVLFFAWRLMNKPGNADFLIATDSEMKKVNWTTRKELIGSTKVVIFFVILISLVLFLLDLAFGYIFYAIGVLQNKPF